MIKIAKLVNLKCVKLIRNVDIVLAPQNVALTPSVKIQEISAFDVANPKF